MRRIVCVAALLLGACNQPETTRVAIALSDNARTALSGLDVETVAKLEVLCGDGKTPAVFHAPFTPDMTEVAFDAVPACGRAELILRLIVEDASTSPILAFYASTSAELYAVPETVVTFSGPLLGEVLLSAEDDASCVVTPGGTVAVEITGGVALPLSLPTGTYDFTCTGISNRVTSFSVTLDAGTRALAPLSFGGSEFAEITSLVATDVGDTSATFSWQVASSSAGPVAVAVQLSTEVAFLEPVVFTTQSETTHTFTGLTPGTNYWARAVAADEFGTGPISALVPIQTLTDLALPRAVNITISNLTSVSASLSFEIVGGTGPYSVFGELADNESFIDADSGTFESSPIPIEGLSPATEHWVRLTVTGGQVTGPTSVPVMFTTAAASSNADLTDLTVEGTQVPYFTSGTTSLYVSVPANRGTVLVAATAADPSAEVAFSGGSSSTGTGQQNVSLQESSTVVNVTVRATDAVTEKNYTLTITKDAPAGLNDVFFSGAATFEPSFSPSNNGPYIVYVPSTTTSVDLYTYCGSSCPNLTLELAGVPLTVTQPTSISTPMAIGSLMLLAEDPETHAEVSYEFILLRGALSGLTLRDAHWDNIALTPTFDPTTLYYSANAIGTEAEAITTIDSRATFSPGSIIELIPGTNTLTYEVRSGLGSLVDTYYVDVTHERVIQAQVNVGTSRVHGGAQRQGMVMRMSDQFNVVMKGRPIVAMKQRPGTPYVYTLHADGSTGMDQVGVMEMQAGSPSQPVFRAFQATDNSDDDYLLPLSTDAEPTSFVFHPTAQALYLWSKLGYVKQISLAGTFLDTGAPGFPTSVSNVDISAWNIGGDTRILLSDDGTQLFAIAKGLGSGNLHWFEINTATGGVLSSNVPISLADVSDAPITPIDAVLSHDASFLWVAYSGGLLRYPVDVGTGTLGAPVNQVLTGLAELAIHPTLDVLYVRRTVITAYQYNASTGVLVSLGEGSGQPLGMSVHYSGKFLAVPLSVPQCGFQAYKLNANGSLGANNMTNTSCSVVMEHVLLPPPTPVAVP